MIEDYSHDTDQQETTIQQSPSAQAIHDSIFQEAESELARPSSALFWSGLAAGLSMGFSMIAESILMAYLPDSDWSHLVSNFGYSINFSLLYLVSSSCSPKTR